MQLSVIERRPKQKRINNKNLHKKKKKIKMNENIAF